MCLFRRGIEDACGFCESILVQIGEYFYAKISIGGKAMSQTVEQISPETLAMIESQARLAGLSVDDYLKSLMPHGIGDGNGHENGQRPLYETATPKELADAITEWAESHDSNAPAIPLESLRRENLY